MYFLKVILISVLEKCELMQCIYLCDVIFRTLCTMCQFKQSFNKYTLRGLCLDSKHDTVYFLERTPEAMPYFKGLSSSVIRWNATTNQWVLNHLRYKAPAFLDEDPVVTCNN